MSGFFKNLTSFWFKPPKNDKEQTQADCSSAELTCTDKLLFTTQNNLATLPKIKQIKLFSNNIDK